MRAQINVTCKRFQHPWCKRASSRRAARVKPKLQLLAQLPLISMDLSDCCPCSLRLLKKEFRNPLGTDKKQNMFHNPFFVDLAEGPETHPHLGLNICFSLKFWTCWNAGRSIRSVRDHNQLNPHVLGTEDASFLHRISQQSKIGSKCAKQDTRHSHRFCNISQKRWVSHGIPETCPEKPLRRGSLDDRANHSQKVLLGALMGPFSFLEYANSLQHMATCYEFSHVPFQLPLQGYRTFLKQCTWMSSLMSILRSTCHASWAPTLMNLHCGNCAFTGGF